jgi:hypothetical protein
VAPLFVIVSGLLHYLQSVAMTAQLFAAAGSTLLLFIVLPLTLARLQGVYLTSGFQLHAASPLAFLAAAALGLTLWPLAYDSIILCQDLGIATITAETLLEKRPALMALIEKLRAVPPWLVLLDCFRRGPRLPSPPRYSVCFMPA